MPDVLPEAPRVSERMAPPIEQPTAAEMSGEEADKAARERLVETRDDILHAEKKQNAVAVQETAPVATTAPVVGAKDEVTIEVEKILEEGLGPFYASLPPEAKPLFKEKGELAAHEISEMLRTLHVRVKRVLQLIYQWLKVIPGVNKFFLEQEAKIKTDRIVALEEERRKSLAE